MLRPFLEKVASQSRVKYQVINLFGIEILSFF